MRKIRSILILSLLLAQQIIAGPVDEKRARAFASQFVEVEGEALRSAQGSATEENPAYYIFNDKGDKGFVIVSGEDRLPLLIGYSDEGQIDAKHLPIQLKALLEQYGKRVAEIRQTPDNGAFRSQKVFMHKPRVIVKALTKSKWGQREPFNELCPEITDGQQAVTGCVATAVAQVMYYHKWPKKGQGSHSYTPKRYGKKLSSDFSQHTYQWNLMKDEYELKWVPDPNRPNWQIKKPVYSQEEGKAIGRLFYDVGVSVDMDFGIGTSGTPVELALTALKDYFDYTTRFLNQSESQENQFLQTIKQELEAQRPIILSGYGSGGGHAWVIDGYDENDYLHCNWGWTGSSDGFFSLSLMNPDALGTGGGAGNFNNGQGLLIAIPNKEGANNELAEELPLAFGDEAGLSLEMPNGTNKNNYFEFKLNAFFNQSKEAFNSVIGVGIYKTDKSFIDIVKEFKVDIKASSGSQYFGQSVTLFETLAKYQDGDYLLRPLFKANGSDKWKPIKKGNTLTIQIQNGSVGIVSDSHILRFRHVMMPREDVQAYTNTTGRATIEVENLSSRYVEAKLGIKLTNLASKKDYKKKLEEVRLPAFSKSVLQPKYKLSDLNLPAGDYAVSFELYCLEKSGNQQTEVKKDIENSFGTFQIKVLDAQTLPKLICTDFSVEQGGKALDSYHLTAEVIEQGAFKFASSIQNKGTIAFNGKLTYRLKNLADSSFVKLGSVEGLNILAGEEREQDETSIKLDMASLKLADGTYRIELIADYQGNEINVWNADIQPYSFVAKDLGNVQEKEFIPLPELKAENGTITYLNHQAGEDVAIGTKIELEVKADEGYELATLKHNDTDIKASKSFVLAKQNNIVASFIKTTVLSEIKKAVLVLPNPASNYVLLKGFTPNAEVSLFTMTGKRVLSSKLAPDGTAKLNVAHLPRGLYLIRSKRLVSKLQIR